MSIVVICASTAAADTNDMLVIDLEVAIVTDTSVIITWFTGSSTATDQYGFPEPVQSDTELQIGLVDPTTLTIVPGSLKTVLQDPPGASGLGTSTTPSTCTTCSARSPTATTPWSGTYPG